MAESFRVEWLATDADGNEHRHISHDMSEADAQAMAATMRAGTARNVRVVGRDST